MEEKKTMMRFSWLVVVLLQVCGCGQIAEKVVLPNGHGPLSRDSVGHVDGKIDSLYFQNASNRDATVAYMENKSLKEKARVTKDSFELAKIYRLIGMNYLMSNDGESALSYYLKAKELFQYLGRWEETMDAVKGVVRTYRSLHRIDQIEQYVLDNLAQYNKAGANSFEANILIHELAVHYQYDLGNCNKAIEYGELFFKNLETYKTKYTNNLRFRIMREKEKDVINLVLGDCYTKTGQLDKAQGHLNKALASYTQRKDYEKLPRVHKAFIEYYLLTGNKEKMVYHKDLFYAAAQNLIDQFRSDQKKITEWEIRSIENESELEALKNENKLKTILIFGALLALLIIAVFQWVNAKLQREKREVALKLEKQYEFNTFKTNLLITVAHELRTPLTIILGHLQLMSENKVDPKDFKLYLDKVKRSSEGILKKMSDIIRLLKDSEKNEALAVEKVELNTFLEDLFFGFEGVANVKKIKLVFKAELPKELVINTDPDILGSLLNNLIVNALKFSGPHTNVVLHATMDKGNLTIAIVDHGIGIGKEEQEIIFNKFSRLSNKKIVDGFGIGLAIVKESAKQLGGKIGVDSSIGKGSTFTFTMPIENLIVDPQREFVPYEKIGGVHNPIGFKKTKGPYKLLIIEDNPEMCSFYSHIFSNLYDCTFAFNGIEGLEILNTCSFDLVLSDVMMPKMDGFELKEKVRAIGNHKDMPYIFVTAKDQPESKVKAFDIGIDDYIVKPFNKDELIARINALILNKKKREKWIFEHGEEEENRPLSIDIKTIQKMKRIVLDHIDQDNFNVMDLAREAGLSQRQLVRVTKKLTGLTPVKFMLEVRLLEAYQKIKNKEMANINDVRYAVGIQSASYFTTQFKKRFGVNPTAVDSYRKNTMVSLDA